MKVKISHTKTTEMELPSVVELVSYFLEKEGYDFRVDARDISFPTRYGLGGVRYLQKEEPITIKKTEAI